MRPQQRGRLCRPVHAVLELHVGLARQEERQPVHPVADDGDPELLEPFRRGRRVHDRLRSAAHEQDRRARQLEEIRRDVRPGAGPCAGCTPPIPPVAATPIPARCAAQIVALTVVAPSDPAATATGTSRRATFVAAPGSKKRASSAGSRPTRTAPSTTAVQAGTAPASSIAADIEEAQARFSGCGRPCPITLVSSATTGRPAATAIATSSATRKVTIGPSATSRATSRDLRPPVRPPGRRRRAPPRRLTPRARDDSSTPSNASPAPVGSCSSIGRAGSRSATPSTTAAAPSDPSFTAAIRNRSPSTRAASRPWRPVSAVASGPFARIASQSAVPRRNRSAPKASTSGQEAASIARIGVRLRSIARTATS